ncbi:MAG: type I addiction module toxin, SymE family [Runella slithyformis]|nr:MAG: type I addiction module toxin, SymE family [Runella slithyformis]TAF48671.1 MAG: type I addiction module toxin, SymE family [Runella slithyformis]
MKRNLKVSKLGRVNVARKVRWVPALKLAGNWLAVAGIAAGSMVEVEVFNQKIVIRCQNTI